jgi:hypothetical protein
MDEVLCLWKNKFIEEEEGGVFICERAGEAELLRIRYILPDSISREFRVRLCGLSLRFVAVEAGAKLVGFEEKVNRGARYDEQWIRWLHFSMNLKIPRA